MSLQLAAQHLSHQGRFGDSTLVHMSPVEVAALQKLAEKHGMSLTINPETGLPEAFSLKKLLPMIAGFALGPAGFGIFSSAMGAGLAVGGVEALRTGDLGRGLMAGLGAYGGASLGAGLSSLGSSAAENAAILAQTGGEEATGQILQEAARRGAADFAAQPFMDRLGQSVSAAMNNPSAFAQSMGGGKGLARAAYMAAVPSLMEQPKTITGMPEINQYMRTFDVDPYGRARALTPYKLGTRPPGGKAGGLTAALANGGAVAFADGGQAGSAQRIQEWWEANQGKASEQDLQNFLVTSGYSAAQINQALPQFKVSDLNNAMRVAQNEVNKRVYAGQLPRASQDSLEYRANVSAIPQSEIDEARKRMYERDPEVAAYLDWRRGQYGLLGTSNALLPEDPTFNPFDISDQTFKEYKDMQEGAKKRGVAEWLDPNWREKQAQKRAETEEFWRKRGEGDIKAGYVTGPGGTPPAPRPTIPGGPPVAPPPPPPGGPPIGPPGPIPPSPPPSGPPTTPPPGQPPYQPPVITGPGKPEDLMSGRSLEAYNALFGKGSTGTKVWQTSPMQAYYPERRGEYYIRRGDSTITTQGGGTPTTFTNPNQRPTVNPGPGMEWFWDTVNMMWKSRPVMTNTSPPGNIFTPDGGNFINQFAANGGIMRSYADGGSTGDGPYFINRNGNIIAVGDISKYTDPYNPPKEDPGPGMRWAWESSKGMWEKAPATGSGGATGGEYFYDAAGNAGATVDGFSPTTSGVQGDSNSITNGLISAIIGQQDAAPVESMGLTAVEGGGGVAGVGIGEGGPSAGGSASGGAGDSAGVASSGAKHGGLLHRYALGGISSLGGYSDGGRLLRGPGDGVSDSIPATIADRRPARLADGEFVVPARIVSELGNGSTEAGARKLYAMMDRVQKARGKTTGRGRVAVNSRADKHLPA